VRFEERTLRWLPPDAMPFVSIPFVSILVLLLRQRWATLLLPICGRCASVRRGRRALVIGAFGATLALSLAALVLLAPNVGDIDAGVRLVFYVFGAATLLLTVPAAILYARLPRVRAERIDAAGIELRGVAAATIARLNEPA
jgi:hypothetical protein